MPDTAQTLCRSCGYLAVFPANLDRCPECGGQRLTRHPEIDALTIAHVDCDAFFASVEKRDRPELKNQPLIVGGGQRGVVSTCCYIARSYGIRSAMPMFKALKACPDAVVIKPDFKKYTEASRQIRSAMQALTPLVQPLSIDEAFLDMSGTEQYHGAAPASMLARLAQQIEEHVGITVSIGLSHNKFLAKLASDMDKPRGFFVIGRDETLGVLAPLPPRAIYGVGKALGDQLARDGWSRLEQFQKADPRLLMKKYGEFGLRLHQLSRGEDHRPVVTERETKSVSSETTFNDDISDKDALKDQLYRLAYKVSIRSKEKELAGRVVTLKLKTSAFTSLTRRVSLTFHTNIAAVLFETVCDLLDTEEPGPQTRRRYRLIGLGLSDLVAEQDSTHDLLSDAEHRALAKKEAAISDLRARFGEEAIGTARDQRLSRKKPRVKGSSNDRH